MNDKYQEMFFNRRSGSGSRFNYDLDPLINDFDFYNFCASAYGDDYGGFLAITDKQFAVGYNAGFGQGSHASSFARFIKDIHGGGDFSASECNMLSSCTSMMYITARIEYEYVGDHYEGYIHFSFPRVITPDEFETFKTFYNKYNDDLKYVCNKFNFHVSFGAYQYKSLDEVYKYIEKNVETDKIKINMERKKVQDYFKRFIPQIVNDNEEIIGIPKEIVSNK